MRFLITGTDTGVGKTFLTVCLLRQFLKGGFKAVGIKPVETGCSPACEDAERISRACGISLNPVYSFRTPVAPSVASKLEEKPIDVERLKERVEECCRGFDYCFIEGAGGLMVPIRENYTFLDLSRELGLKVIVVALNRLGVINHTLLTVKACQCEGVEVASIFLNRFGESETDRSRETNLDVLRSVLNVPVFEFRGEGDVLPFINEITGR